MKTFIPPLRAALMIFLAASPGLAQINPGGIVNIGSFRPQGLPNSMIAQGSIFAVFGVRDLAADGLALAGFPLPLELGGTSAQVTVNGTTVDCFMLFTTPSQLAIILPSSTPVGGGMLTLTTRNRIERQFTEPIEVVAHSPGVFTQNSQGSGPGSFQNFVTQTDQPLNQVDTAIQSNGVGTLWLTGLGPASGDEAAGPLPGHMAGVDIKVFVGGVQVTEILYAGRSGCCAGIDQVVFRIPAGVQGCWLPVVVFVEGVPSNFTTISVAQNGSVCSEPDAFTPQQLSSALASGSVSTGVIRFETASAESGAAGDEFGKATFERLDAAAFRRASPPRELATRNSCQVFAFQRTAEFREVTGAQALNAGNLTAVGAAGDRTIARVGDAYSSVLGSEGRGRTRGGGGGQPSFLAPGMFSVNAAGAQVGPFSASRNYTDGLVWTNKDDIGTIQRDQGVTVTWTGADSSEEDAWIWGAASADRRQARRRRIDAAGAAFFCRVDASLGSFTIGPEVLGALPATALTSSDGTLQVGAIGLPRTFSAEGLDLAWFSYLITQSKVVQYE